MPRVAPPKDGDLPIFPSAQQFSGTTEVNTLQHRTRAPPHQGTASPRHRTPVPAAANQNAAPAQRRPEGHQMQRPPGGTNRIPARHTQPAPRQVEQRQAYVDNQHRATYVDPRIAPVDEMRRMNVGAQQASFDQQQANGNRRPILGVQTTGGRNSPHGQGGANFVGQAFGIVPEDTSRAPPYDPVLWKIFCQVDSDGSGAITQTELAHALINGDFTPFHTDTIALMIRLFDEDRNGTISFGEFEKLWKYLLEWKTLFARFDSDHSGTINFSEFGESLAAFGYRLNTSFVQFLFRYHDKTRTKEMSFDLFVQSCVTLKLFTDVFRRFDTDMDGVITIGFEDFLKVMIKNR